MPSDQPATIVVLNTLVKNNYSPCVGTGTALDGPARGAVGLRARIPGMSDVAGPPQPGSTSSSVRRVKLTDVTDGLTNTILFAELLQHPDQADGRGLIWYADAGISTYALPNTTAPDQEIGCVNQPTQNLPCIFGGAQVQFARSRHSGGVNVALGDGSVRFVRNTLTRRPGWRLEVWPAERSARVSIKLTFEQPRMHVGRSEPNSSDGSEPVPR